ncbi:MAG: hypothetical protein ACI9MC_001068 [Kiritimatiellia bacterium]|jgi:hypothetical protein
MLMPIREVYNVSYAKKREVASRLALTVHRARIDSCLHAHRGVAALPSSRRIGHHPS